MLNHTYFLRFWVPGPDRGFYENFQYVRGFLQLQDLVDRAILRATQEDLGVNSMVDIDEFGVYTQEIPYPCFTRQKYAYYYKTYSKVWNKRSPPNKRTPWKILQKE